MNVLQKTAENPIPPESLTLRLDRPVQTRDGRPVRILCTDAEGRNPIVGLIKQAAGEYAEQWKPDGTYGDSNCNHMGHLIMMGAYRHMDLVNA